MLSQEQALGRIFQLPAPVTVTQADLNALAAALGYDVPVSWAPPTYMFVLAEPAFTAFYTDPELELRLQNIIHVSQSFEYVRPVIPGDVLRVILTINKLQIRGEAEFITLNGVVTAADDSVVATFISVVLHRRYTVSSPNSVTQPARSARTEHANPKLQSKTIALTRELLSRYAVVSGDSNPIHLDDTAARALGLSGVLAHGMWTMGAAAKVVLDWLEGDAPRLKSYRTRFAAPLYVPVSGVNVEVNAEVSGNSADTTTVSLEVSCGGVKILNGTQIEVHNV